MNILLRKSNSMNFIKLREKKNKAFIIFLKRVIKYTFELYSENYNFTVEFYN
jgi:hypothetical protein